MADANGDETSANDRTENDADNARLGNQRTAMERAILEHARRQKLDERYRRKRKTHRHDRFDFAALATNIGTVLFAAVAAGAAAWLAFDTDKSIGDAKKAAEVVHLDNTKALDAAKAAILQGKNQFIRDERPYIWIDSDPEGPQFILHPDTTKGEGQTIWKYTLRNYGKSVAYGVTVDPREIEVGGSWKRSYCGRKDGCPGQGAPVPPTGTIFGDVVDAPGQTSATFGRFLSQDHGIGFRIKVTYTDGYGNPFETEVCMRRLRTGANQYCADHNGIK